jgi:D-arabinose 1-dehydrogenase-like Zn-dependent alcohol dehydrogenase
MSTTIKLDEVVDAGRRIVEGKVRGRTVVEIG